MFQTDNRRRQSPVSNQGKNKRQLGSRLESQLELLDDRVLAILNRNTLGKSELAKRLGQKQASGALHMSIRALLEKGLIARTLPGKTNRRLQKYCFTQKGEAYLGMISS